MRTYAAALALLLTLTACGAATSPPEPPERTAQAETAPGR